MFKLEFRLDVGEGATVAVVPYDTDRLMPYHIFADTAYRVEESITYDYAVLSGNASPSFVIVSSEKSAGWIVYKEADWERLDTDQADVPSFLIEARDRRNFAVVLDALFFHLWWGGVAEII